MSGQARILRDGTRVWLEGVWDAPCGIDWDASQRALAAAVSSTTGRPVDFDEMLVASGDAFAAVSSDVYQDVTYLAAARDVMGEAARYYGFNGTWAFPNSFDAARQVVQREVDAGRAVAAGGAAQAYGCPPWDSSSGTTRTPRNSCSPVTARPAGRDGTMSVATAGGRAPARGTAAYGVFSRSATRFGLSAHCSRWGPLYP